ncbi:NAD-dependent succinate-semialdehyde dehydrogenase [Candidatus Woesearchaeota archaeon]|nr:NAD-dependent succinate-semialdehyde dehydrogenase [Candidatus Woesearchaeota archaeon]
MPLYSINPYTEATSATIPMHTLEDAREMIRQARAALESWKQTSLKERASLLHRLGRVLEENAEAYAALITTEMGKPIKEAIAEVKKCALTCAYYADNGETFLHDERITTNYSKSYVTFEPLGIVFAIMPWNFPFWQVFRCAIPAVLAGNVVVLKHASNVPLCAKEIQKCFNDAGFPQSVFTTLLIDATTAQQIIGEDLIDAVSLTGSNAAGSEIGMLAGKYIKPLVLELGGSDPFLVLDDADIAKAATMGIKARFINTGQSCIAAKRFIIMDTVAAAFEKKVLELMEQLSIGDPLDPKTDIGPLAKASFVHDLQRQLQATAAPGGMIKSRGKIPSQGYFFTPTLVKNPPRTSPVWCEEVFGPIMPMVTVATEEELIQTANDTPFGLGASIWSRNITHAETIAKKIQAGFVAINDLVKSDPRLPFGGIKKSGIGRELSVYGIREFVNIKTVVIENP